MQLLLSTLGAVALLATSAVHAADPVGTVGHQAVIVENAIFFSGGDSAPQTPQSNAYALALGEDGTMSGATFYDITAMSGSKNNRDFHSSVDTTHGGVVNCGTLSTAASGKSLTCDYLDTATLKLQVNNVTAAVTTTAYIARGGMGVATDGNFAYFTGGAAPGTNGTIYNSMDVLELTKLGWRSGISMPVALKYHTASWVDNLSSIVVLGGQAQAGTAVAMNQAYVYTNSNWTTRAIAGDTVAARFGHSAVVDDNGILTVYGGMSTAGGASLGDVYQLNTSATWAWKKVNVNAEPRAFHQGTLMPSSAIMYTFGQSVPTSYLNTYSILNLTNNAWTPAAAFPPATVISVSPFQPGTNQFANPSGGSGGASSGLGTGAIVGIAVGALAVLAIGGLIFHRSRNGGIIGGGGRKRSNNNGNGDYQYSSKHQEATGGNGGAKLGRSFTIREPESAYIHDDQDLDQTGHPRYNSDADARHNPYYGDRAPTNLVEYELTDTNNQNYSPGIVAERKRYVEQQQRKVMDEYEMYNPPSQQSQLYNDGPSSPTSYSSPRSNNNNYGAPTSPTYQNQQAYSNQSMGSRSPRVQNQRQQQPMHLGNGNDDGYRY